MERISGKWEDLLLLLHIIPSRYARTYSRCQFLPGYTRLFSLAWFGRSSFSSSGLLELQG